VQAIDDSQPSPRRAALVAALRRSAVLILVLAALGTLLGVTAGLRRAEDHTAQASILVSPLEGNPFSPTGNGDDLVNLETEAQLVQSDPVARDVATRVGDNGSIAGLLAGLDVTVPTNTQILTIAYTAGSDEAAARRAQGFADAYLAFRTARSEQVVRSRTERIQGQIDSQNRLLSGLVEKFNVEKVAATKTLLHDQIDDVTSQISQLRAQLAELRTGSVDPGQVIKPASAVGTSLLAATAVYALAGLVAGLVLALAVVIVRARAENRIHHADDIDASGFPLLGSISRREVLDTNARIVSGDTIDGFEIEKGFQTLRVSILSRERRRPVRILYAAAAQGSEAPGTALALAYAAAASGLNTVLVDAARGPDAITALLELESRPGFSDILAGTLSIDQVITQVTDHLQVLPSGHLDPHTDDLLTGPRVGTVLQDLEKVADILIVATGPMQSPRSRALVMVTDVTVVEAVESQSRLGDLVAITEDPTAAESVLGVVFVGRARSRSHKHSKT
jgi:succinoglycan biosynthesis transport protein ExoP